MWRRASPCDAAGSHRPGRRRAALDGGGVGRAAPAPAALHPPGAVGCVVAVGAGQDGRQRGSVGIGEQVMLTPGLAPVRGIGAVFFPVAHCPHQPAVHTSPGPVQAMGPLQSGQRGFVEARPHSGGLPLLQPTPAGHPGTAVHFLGQHLPGNAAFQYEQNAGQGFPVVNALASGVAEPPGFGSGQQRLHHCPQLITYQRLCQRPLLVLQ